MIRQFNESDKHYDSTGTRRRSLKSIEQEVLLFDMDGTLLDSMHQWHGLVDRYLDMHQEQITEEMRSEMSHMMVREVAKQLHEKYHFPQSPEEIIRAVYALMAKHYEEDVTVKEGVVEYLEQCRAEGKRMAVVTATARDLAIPALKDLRLEPYFDLILSTSDIGVNKLRPDIYIRAARELGAMENRQAAVFEDAPYALKTAAKAGFYTVLIDDPVFREEQAGCLHLADAHYMSMEDLLY